MLNRRNLLSSALPALAIAPAIAGKVSAAGHDEQWADATIAELTALMIRTEPTRTEGKLAVVSALLSALASDDPSFDHFSFEEWDNSVMPRLKRLEDELRRRSDRARGRSV
jgi:hypothetical protein